MQDAAAAVTESPARRAHDAVKFAREVAARLNLPDVQTMARDLMDAEDSVRVLSIELRNARQMYREWMRLAHERAERIVQLEQRLGAR